MKAGMMMKIDWTFKGDSDINLHIDVTDKIAILWSDSGTGKTFMFHMLESYFVTKGITYRKFDYNVEGQDIEWIKQGIEKADIILLDNADLYMTRELFEYLKSSGKQAMISIKHTEKLGSFENCGFYTVEYDGETMRTVRGNYGFII